MVLQYDLFLCHNKSNKDWVRKLAIDVENEDYENRKLKVFFDEWDIQPGANIVLEINKALYQSRFVGVVVSPEMLQADWPTMEWTIAVSNDPSGRKNKVIPIWLGDCDIPGPLKIRNVLYFRNEVEYRKSYPKLIRMLKNQSLPRGGTTTNYNANDSRFTLAYQDEQNEQLASNLFPVIYRPDIIWSGPIGTLSHKDVFKHLLNAVKGTHPTFLIREKRLYSFWDLNHYNCPFREILTGDSIQKESVKSWISDPIKNRWLIELFNRALKGHCWELDLIYDKNHRRFFFPPLGGEDRTEIWHTGERRSTRHITTKRIKGKSKQIFWSHQALRAKFMSVGDEFYLWLVPAWTFTVDGTNTLTGKDVGIFSTKWTTKEHNQSVLYHVRFWSRILSKNSEKISIRLGVEKLDVDITPAVIELPVGIEGDFHPIEKVYKTATEEIESTEVTRGQMLQGDDNDE